MGVMRKLRRKNHKEQYWIEPLRQEHAFPVRKMSDVIPEFAEPILDTIDDDELFEEVISFAVICWNLSFLPEQQQLAQWNNFANEVGTSQLLSHTEIEDWVWILLERKRTFFADDRRIVMNYKVIDEGDHNRLLVMSTLAED